MGNLIGGVFAKPSSKFRQTEKLIEKHSETKEKTHSSILSKRPSLTEIIALCPNGKPVEFTWKHGGCNSIIVTGSFDNWSSSIHLAKDQANDMWRKTVLLDQTKPHQFKFVVDGVWRCSMDWDTCTDSQGNVNNIISL